MNTVTQKATVAVYPDKVEFRSVSMTYFVEISCDVTYLSTSQSVKRRIFKPMLYISEIMLVKKCK
jgi:hypothetical protein